MSMGGSDCTEDKALVCSAKLFDWSRKLVLHLFHAVHSLCPVVILSSYWLFLTPSLFGFPAVNNLGLVPGDRMKNHSMRAKSRPIIAAIFKPHFLF